MAACIPNWFFHGETDPLPLGMNETDQRNASMALCDLHCSPKFITAYDPYAETQEITIREVYVAEVARDLRNGRAPRFT